MNSGLRSSRTKLHGAASIIVFLAAGFGVAAADIVTFTIVGRVQFSVPGDWVVIASKSGGTRTTFAFQIKNPADEGTPDSTNLAVNSYYLKDHNAKDAFDKRRSSQDPKAHTKELTDNWECSTFSALQDTTSYEDWDCFRTINECGVFVRMAWPHLPKNPPDYDDQMKTALVDVLRSFAPSPK